MKKQILLIAVAILFIGTSSLYISRKYDPATGSFLLDENPAGGKDGFSKQQLAGAAMQWRYDHLKDENGNLYPSYFTNALSTANRAQQHGTRAGLGLQWEELGPDNVGGRTRAILVDKRDPTNQTVYAGGVSGGMWKSTDAGATWNRLANWNEWLTIASIAQAPAPDYTIYIGTGEGLSQISGSSMNSGSMGNGIYKLDANDNPILLTPDILANNALTPPSSSVWSSVNRIAINPLDPGMIIAATTKGLYQSNDHGLTWGAVNLTGNLHALLGLQADDIKWSPGGTYIYASLGGVFSGNLIMSQNGGVSWIRITSGTNTGFPAGSLGRIEIAVAPSSDTIAYIAVAKANTGCTQGVYRTSDGGNTWTTIGSSGALFQPFEEGGNAGCQGWYDNVIAVNPFNPNKVYLGGINFYTWSDQNGWKLADAGLGSGAVNPNYIHPDKHAIVFANGDSDVMYIGCDGGIYKSIDAGSAFPFPQYVVHNRGYAVTQNYGVSAALTGEVMGGSQDNGTNYVNYLGNTFGAGEEVLGGDGMFSAISHIDQKIFFGSIYYAALYRSGNYTSGFAGIYDIKIDPQGIGSTSICGNANPAYDAPFVTPFLLGETKTAANGFKKVAFAANTNYSAGEVVTVNSNTASYPFQVTLSQAVNAGDTIMVDDPVRSRLFLSSNCGVYVTSDALTLGTIPHWYKLSNSFGGVGESYANSTDGDVLYVGTSSGSVYRFPNLNARCDTTTYPLGSNIAALYTNTNQFTVKSLGSQSVEGIAVDPDDNNHVVATLAGFSSNNSPHVYESHNGGQTWVADTAGLPNMPVYSV
ncbi:MAG TPA: sialidase family protein, partial [Chitinophagales bacterium]|nr:sialidase family protein [Chitinophagales bacterium]